MCGFGGCWPGRIGDPFSCWRPSDEGPTTSSAIATRTGQVLVAQAAAPAADRRVGLLERQRLRDDVDQRPHPHHGVPDQRHPKALWGGCFRPRRRRASDGERLTSVEIASFFILLVFAGME